MNAILFAAAWQALIANYEVCFTQPSQRVFQAWITEVDPILWTKKWVSLSVWQAGVGIVPNPPNPG